MLTHLATQDGAVYEAVCGELARQRGTIELIASENFPSLAVLETVGTVLMNKYAEGYPAARYYGGCDEVDIVEDLARTRACELFGAEFANVQPHSGSQANFAAYAALIKPGDTILGMSLSGGGHLTHGSPANFSGKLYNVVGYGLNPETERLDYDEIEALAKEHRPALIMAGASAYPRIIDFERLRAIADEVDAYLVVDMAHIAGLVAGGAHPSPVPWAHVVTSTSHKTLRGPRGGFILTNDEAIAAAIDKAIFPGSQGGPLMHVIAAKAVAFGEALKPAFADYAHAVVANCQAMADGLVEGGLRLVTGGTDNHLALVDLTASGVCGRDAQQLIETVGMTANKNVIPNEPLPPSKASGIRVGSAAATTRGFTAEDFHLVGTLIAKTLFNRDDETALAEVRDQTSALLAAHPLYPGLEY